jgi:ribosomal protein S18 acetylase RimI-like enzyme
MDSAPALAIFDITDADVPAIIALWQRCGLTRPWNDPAADIALARRGDRTANAADEHGGTVAASAMVGHDGHRGWVYYVSVDPEHRGRNLGRAIMTAAEDWLRARSISKLMLMVRGDNTTVQEFYQALDYAVQDSVVFSKWLDGRPPTPGMK